MATSNTIGAFTTMAKTSVNGDELSQATMSGTAGLRPPNMFHRDEMF